MSKFSHLTKLDVRKDMETRITLYQITGEPILILSPATEANKPYYNQVLKQQRNAATMIRIKGSITPEQVAKSRDEDKQLYPKHIVKGWENVLDDKGKKVSYSTEACEEFLEALPNYIFDEIRNHAQLPSNFFDEIDIEEAEKN
jgi:hypothetical protein